MPEFLPSIPVDPAQNESKKDSEGQTDEKKNLTSGISGFFNGLMGKKEQTSTPSQSANLPEAIPSQALSVDLHTLQSAPEPAAPLIIPAVTPPAPAPPLGNNPSTAPAATSSLPNLSSPVLPATLQSIKKESAPIKSGNLFTRLFKGSKIEEKKGSIIDAIVDKTESEKNREKEAKKAAKEAEKQAKKALKKPSDGLSLFRAARFFFHFTLLFIAVGTGFLYVQIVDVNNSVFNWFNGPENYASRLHENQAQLDELTRQEKELKGEVVVFQEGYSDPNEALVKQIVETRSNWPEVEEQLYGAAERLYSLNDFFNYLEYTNFNLDFETGQVSFTASLRDPGGNNFSALADFENILKFYPGDPQEDDGIKPYFTGIQEINNYSERYDANTDTYETVFSMTAKINSGDSSDVL